MMQRRRSTRGLKEGSSVSVSALAFIIRLPIEGSAAQDGINPQCISLHSLPPRWRRMTGMWGEALGGNVKAGFVQRQIAVEIPANPNVTKLERSGDAATHLSSRPIGERWQGRFSWLLFLLRPLRDRLRHLRRLDLACTPKK